MELLAVIFVCGFAVVTIIMVIWHANDDKEQRRKLCDEIRRRKWVRNNDKEQGHENEIPSRNS